MVFQPRQGLISSDGHVAWVTEIYPALGTITFTDWNNPLPYHTATHTISLAAWPGLQYIYANP